MVTLLAHLKSVLEAQGLAWYDKALTEVRTDPSRLPVLLPQLPRRLGRAPIGQNRLSGALTDGDEYEIDLHAWGICDAAAYGLFEAVGATTDPSRVDLVDLWSHGDMEERTMVMRCLALLPLSAATAKLLGEAQRTNTQTHFEAAALDSNLVARCTGDSKAESQDFGIGEFNAMVLKLAFSDLPFDRAYGAIAHANRDLSYKIQNLATEREAATRKVWYDTNLVIAHAAVQGSVARVLGGLEHGDDHHRLAAARGLPALNRPDLMALAIERLPREPRPEIKAALEQAIATIGQKS